MSKCPSYISPALWAVSGEVRGVIDKLELLAGPINALTENDRRLATKALNMQLSDLITSYERGY